jgi:mono/diheme cytochrome c family protein
VSIASKLPLDVWNQNAAKTAMSRLDGVEDAVVDEHPMAAIPTHLNPEEQEQFKRGHEVYFRDAHCATCHQPNGKGLDPAFPPLAQSEWVTGDPERLIKLTMHGMMGPLEVNGKKYAGLVPMTAFGGILKDDEMAAVLTYVRNSFGNKAPSIQPSQIGAVREATKSQQGFYMADDLLKQHPMK